MFIPFICLYESFQGFGHFCGQLHGTVPPISVQALDGVFLISGDALHIIPISGGFALVLFESAQVMVWWEHLARPFCLRTMHGGGVKSWNGVVYGTRFGTLFIYIVPFRGVPAGN